MYTEFLLYIVFYGSKWFHFFCIFLIDKFSVLGDKPLGDREMLLKKKRASTTDLSNNGETMENLPDDDMGKFIV